MLSSIVVTRVRPHTVKRRRHVTAVLTVLAFAFAGMVGRVHEATTSHVRCAEHGELIHGVVPDAAAVVAATPQASQDRVAHDGPRAPGEPHEHCLLAYASREVSTEARGLALTSIALPTTNIARARPDVPAPRRDGVYRTAPKTSPPA